MSAVEEVSAALGAAVAAGVPPEFDALLREVRTDLSALDRHPSPDRLRGFGRPEGAAFPAGTSSAAGLLLLARAIVDRAARETPSAYLDALAELLLVVAYRTEEADRAAQWGLCAAEDQVLVVGPTVWSR